MKSAKEHNAEYLAKYPGHCGWCGGGGFISYPGGWYEPPSSDPCGHCLELGKCPRCGVTVTSDEVELDKFMDGDISCPGCGWNVVSPVLDAEHYGLEDESYDFYEELRQQEPAL